VRAYKEGLQAVDLKETDSAAEVGPASAARGTWRPAHGMRRNEERRGEESINSGVANKIKSRGTTHRRGVWLWKEFR
jgi:hypothetical protein